MKVRYFVVGVGNQLAKVSHAAVRALWDGTRGAQSLGVATEHEMRLVSVLCNSQLQPRSLYVLRVPLSDGMLTEAGRLALQAFARPDCVTPQELVEHHTAGWPRDFFPQLAVALDVPVAQLKVPLGVGGPLLLAAALHVTPAQAVRYLH